ncbi:hypothetical protein [Methylobacterium nodulans]|uniref:Uncharacterized protein n=1 Tax=Methylobacterium nodulans (strain LMG 21967 / CNCM I-2342 / ORS 2060) TaxID=460265 RepID=B8IDU6_METNO|nr:hypothetical protein [Methylobacterium nodulans]ACL55668.1 hypothetical protein Mnod_0634 [Methylobacterium nodulans ORS 2060]
MNVAFKLEPLDKKLPEVEDLATRVAVARVAAALEANPGVKSLFSIVGLDKTLTCAIARRIDAEVRDSMVRVHISVITHGVRASAA